MRVDSGFSQLSRLQAQQAFTPTRRQAQEELETPEVQAPVIENLKPEVKPNGRMTAPVSVDEIQDIARRAGYLEVSESDIQRAYVFGESLLTDYTV